jgi:hypothetical protein
MRLQFSASCLILTIVFIFKYQNIGMKLNTYLTLLLCLIFNSVYSQITIEGRVVDAMTKEPITFVNIGIVEYNIGTVSDYNGKFKLEYKSAHDVIIFSSIGFESVKFTVAEVQDLRDISLSPRAYTIETININAQRFDEIDRMFGVKNESRGHSIGFGSSQLGTEIGAPIKFETTAYIKSANFTINHAKGDSMVFRVNIYEFNDGKIGENILTENIIIRAKQTKGLITIDLENKNIVLKSDVLLSLEWITDDKGRGNVGLTFDSRKSKKPNGIYLKYISHGAFKRIPHKLKITPCFYLIGNSVNSE